MINRQDKLDIHCNLYDSSFVEYFLDDDRGNFDVLFDQRLYEPPQPVTDFEQRMLAEEEEAKKEKSSR